jgi:hypothetical protein
MTDRSDLDITTWRAPRQTQAFAMAAIVALGVVVALVMTRYGITASLLGGLLVLAAIGQVWWMILRPRLTAGPDGVVIVAARTPVRLAWKEIRGVQASTDGLKITVANGREESATYPRLGRGEAKGTGEAERVAAFLMQRAAYARRPTPGPPPTYTASEG